MYALMKQLLGYTGSTNVDQYLIYGSICLTIIFVVVFLDVIYRFFMRFIPRG